MLMHPPASTWTVRHPTPTMTCRPIQQPLNTVVTARHPSPMTRSGAPGAPLAAVPPRSMSMPNTPRAQGAPCIGGREAHAAAAPRRHALGGHGLQAAPEVASDSGCLEARNRLLQQSVEQLQEKVKTLEEQAERDRRVLRSAVDTVQAFFVAQRQQNEKLEFLTEVIHRDMKPPAVCQPSPGAAWASHMDALATAAGQTEAAWDRAQEIASAHVVGDDACKKVGPHNLSGVRTLECRKMSGDTSSTGCVTSVDSTASSHKEEQRDDTASAGDDADSDADSATPLDTANDDSEELLPEHRLTKRYNSFRMVLNADASAESDVGDDEDTVETTYGVLISPDGPQTWQSYTDTGLYTLPEEQGAGELVQLLPMLSELCRRVGQLEEDCFFVRDVLKAPTHHGRAMRERWQEMRSSFVASQ
eukprot:TRINITY_DN21067_c0_g1_i1.p1 TRINITY_DN21067_c0_g1~~TRINITY_DN21067_c0_g1_i1.p1  ORF type:complete len:417 (-),score=81.11 TRINITY_DN21067_c0_g1_i1:174-1424(-)